MPTTSRCGFSSLHKRKAISLANKGPCSQVFMSDGWSCDMRSRTTAAHGDARVDRISRLRKEFALQRSIVKCKTGDQWHMVVKVQRPRPLATKKCADTFTAGCDFASIMALSGHKGVGIHVYIQDGQFAKPFGRRMIARHCLSSEKRPLPLCFQF